MLDQIFIVLGILLVIVILFFIVMFKLGMVSFETTNKKTGEVKQYGKDQEK